MPIKPLPWLAVHSSSPHHFIKKEEMHRECWRQMANLYLQAACFFRSFLSSADWRISGLPISLQRILSPPISLFILSGPISVGYVCWQGAWAFLYQDFENGQPCFQAL